MDKREYYKKVTGCFPINEIIKIYNKKYLYVCRIQNTYDCDSKHIYTEWMKTIDTFDNIMFLHKNNLKMIDNLNNSEINPNVYHLYHMLYEIDRNNKIINLIESASITDSSDLTCKLRFGLTNIRIDEMDVNIDGYNHSN